VTWELEAERGKVRETKGSMQVQLSAREREVADLTEQLQNARGRILGLEEESGLFQGISEESAKIVHEIYTALKSTGSDVTLDSLGGGGGGGSGGSSRGGESGGGSSSARRR
jgi:hypothetical protein